MIAWNAVLLCVAAMGVSMSRTSEALIEPIDSYVCVRAESNPTVNPGCHTNSIEKGVR